MVGADGGQTKVIEQGGQGVLGGVQPKDPFRVKQCRWQEPCMVDHTKYDCMDSNLVYRITCNRCSFNIKEIRDQQQYLGQSGRSMHARQAEHAQGLKNGSTSCPLVRHVMDQHQGDKPSLDTFTMYKVMTTKDNMTRLLGEGEEIGKAEAGGSMLQNSKGEYGRAKLIRWKQTVDRI